MTLGRLLERGKDINKETRRESVCAETDQRFGASIGRRRVRLADFQAQARHFQRPGPLFSAAAKNRRFFSGHRYSKLSG